MDSVEIETLFAEATSPDLHHSLSVIVASAVYVTLTKGDWEDFETGMVIVLELSLYHGIWTSYRRMRLRGTLKGVSMLD